jgi:transposase
MIGWEQFMDVKALAAEGVSKREIARRTGLARNTVRKVLRGEHPMRMKPVARGSKLDPYKAHVRERFEAYGLSAVRLIEEIRPLGYTGSIVTLRRFLKTLKAPAERLRRVTVRFETPPGQQAQVDWSECGRFELGGGRKLTVYAFLMVLGYSRAMYVRFTASMRMAELIACHQAAFAAFGGWPKEILYDNMKQVRIGPGRLNEAFMDFAAHHGFAVKTCRPYRPRTKGKVERPVDYLKDNFLAGRTFAGLEDLNAQVLHWLDCTANVRVHGTTGAAPRERLAEETLTPVSAVAPYRFTQPVTRLVSREALVCFQGSRYSAPPALAGTSVRVSAEGGVLRIVAGEEVVAEHRQALKSGQCVVAREHLAELWKLTDAQIAAPRAAMAERWHLLAAERVEQVPLTVFETVAA